jgi:asparagine synthase (glutamine-hydrolysing)
MRPLFGLFVAEPLEFPEGVAGEISESLPTGDRNEIQFFSERGALLAMTRVAVSDHPQPVGPLTNESGRIRAACAGEIHNHREIAHSLRKSGHLFSTDQPFEVLVHLAETTRLDWELGLRGGFAFALWDRHERSLHLARDRFGIQPLFWCGDDRGIAFASTLPVLRTLLLTLGNRGLDRTGSPALDAFLKPEGWKLRKEALPEYLDTLTVAAPNTFYQGIHSLPPAHRLEWAPDRPPRATCYWTPTYVPKRRMDRESALHEFGQTFGDAIRSHLLPHAPVAALLSADPNSALVAAEAASRLGRKLRTYTFAFQESDRRELARARELAECLGTDHQEILLDPFWASDLPLLIDALDQPFGDPGLLKTWKMAERVGEERSVVLSGDGGDEVWGGHPYYSIYNRTRFLPKTHHHPDSPPFGSAVRGTPRETWRNAFLDAPTLYRGWHRRDSTGQLARHALLADFQPDSEACETGFIPEGMTEHDWMLSQDVTGYLPFNRLIRLQTASVGNSLAMRLPWLDPFLFECVAHYPRHLKISGGVTGWLVRLALSRRRRPTLPASLFEKKRRPSGRPFDLWLKGEEFACLFSESVLARDSMAGRLFDPLFLRAAFEAHRAGVAKRGPFLWAVLVLEFWLWRNRVGL